jgi:hypothetical protein
MAGLIYRLYLAGEARATSALENLVGSNGFGELLALSASNAMALAKVANRSADRGVRLVRLAGRSDITSLARQLARTEDTLERVLELVEELSDRLDEAPGRSAEPEPNGTRKVAVANHRRPAAASRRSP